MRWTAHLQARVNLGTPRLGRRPLGLFGRQRRVQVTELARRLLGRALAASELGLELTQRSIGCR